MISTKNAFWKTQIYNKYLITFVFSIINAFFNFYFFRSALKNLGEESFYYYAYSRRIIAFVSPILIMGIGVGLPRYMGVYFKYKRDTSILLSSSLVIVSIMAIVWGMFNLTFNEFMTSIIWGKVSKFTLSLNLSISLFLFSFCLWGIIHSYFRGKIMVVTSGILLLIVESFIPFLGFYFINSLNIIYYFISTSLIGFAVVMLIILFKKKFVFPSYTVIIKLLKYGIRRIPGDLAFSLLVFLPSFFAITLLNIEYAGIISFAGAILTLSALPASAISFNILSRSAFLFLNNKKLLKNEVKKILIVGILYGIITYTFFKFMLVDLITWFMDPALLKYIEIMEYFLIAIPAYVIFILLRSVIDGTKIKAYNSRNLLISLIVFLTFALIAILYHSVNTIIFGIIAAYFSLGLLSLIRVYKIFKE